MTASCSKICVWVSEALVVPMVYYMSYIGSKVTATALQTCMTYMHGIKSLLLFAYMTYMYVIHVCKAVAVILDPIYDI